MNTSTLQSSGSDPWNPILPPNPPMTSQFWETRNVYSQLRDLQETLKLAEAMQKELEELVSKHGKGTGEDMDTGSVASSNDGVSKLVEGRRINFEIQEALSVKAANSLIYKLKVQLEPFRVITDGTSPWEEKSAAFRLFDRIKKSKRNKIWRKRKRKRILEIVAKECEQFEQADKEADEWRAQEIAKDIAGRKVEKMKEIARLKEKEEKKILESELELVLIVEKLQELRSIRIEKLKKQGHFLPQEDDKFLEKVRAAVEEEERQAIAAADTVVAKDAIATAEESRCTIHQTTVSDSKERNIVVYNCVEYQATETDNGEGATIVSDKGNLKQGSDQVYVGAFDSVANLPIEFYHYYYGSNNDMGTLIEVRRTWDAYIRPGGSRIPGHWVRPPPPADEVWASYLLKDG